MKNAFLFALAVVMAAPAARAQAAWPVIFRDASVTVALDSSSAQKNSDGSYMTRTRWDYAKLHALESRRPYLSMTQAALIRCTPVRIKRLTESFYSANGSVVREGATVNPGDVKYMTWDRMKTGTDASKAYSAACSMLTRRDRKR